MLPIDVNFTRTAKFYADECICARGGSKGGQGVTPQSEVRPPLPPKVKFLVSVTEHLG